MVPTPATAPASRAARPAVPIRARYAASVRHPPLTEAYVHYGVALRADIGAVAAARARALLGRPPAGQAAGCTAAWHDLCAPLGRLKDEALCAGLYEAAAGACAHGRTKTAQGEGGRRRRQVLTATARRHPERCRPALLPSPPTCPPGKPNQEGLGRGRERSGRGQGAAAVSSQTIRPKRRVAQLLRLPELRPVQVQAPAPQDTASSPGYCHLPRLPTAPPFRHSLSVGRRARTARRAGGGAAQAGCSAGVAGASGTSHLKRHRQAASQAGHHHSGLGG